MADLNTSYLTCRTIVEATATPRTLKTIIEAVLNASLPGVLVVSCTIQNQSANDAKISSDSAATHYVLIQPQVSRQLVLPTTRLNLNEVYLKVGADLDPITIEIVFE